MKVKIYTCSSCNGTGIDMKKDAKKKVCSSCNGAGKKEYYYK